MNEVIDYSNSALSLLVPAIVVVMVIITKRVVISLLSGIIVGAIMINFNKLSNVLPYLYEQFSARFYSFEEFNATVNGHEIVKSSIKIEWWGVNIMIFLLLLGIMSQIVLHSGAVGAFVRWARRHVKTARSSEFLSYIAGIVIFVDDYFNALTVGQVSRSIIDSQGSTRERLAYIIDSTSAPVCVLVPISSWGAYILGLFSQENGLIANSGLGDPFFVLLATIPNNFYAWFALLMVFFTILWQIDLPVMRRNRNVDVDIDNVDDCVENASSVYLMIVPIVTLIIATIVGLGYFGYSTDGGDNSLVSILSRTDSSPSLLFGGVIALIVTIIISNNNIKMGTWGQIIVEGVGSMLPAILILVCAWTISPIIKNDIQTGVYLGEVVRNMNISVQVLPFILFVVSSLMALATGTSWGTFAIMIPISVNMIGGDSATLSIMGVSAVLSGAVYGDHISPISDTTILSSTGAGSSLYSHFITQMPYASLSALCAAVSFLIGGFYENTTLSFISGFVLILFIAFVMKIKYGKSVT